jgi:hypothetical protein
MGLTKPRAYQIFDIDYKQSVRVITLTNISLTGGAPSSVDGVNLSAGDRILVAGQGTGSQNGLYQVSVLGTGENGTWIRSVDANETGEVDAGMIVMVTEGEVYKDTQWKLTTNDPITIGVTDLVFEQNSAFAFGNIYANGTAVLADIVGDTVTFTPADNLIITANATTDTITFAVSQSPDFTGNFAVTGTVGSNLIPTANVTYDLGNTTNRWNDIWLANSTVYLGNAQISANATSLILTTPEGAQVVLSGSSAEISASTVTATGNITGGNLITSGILSVTGNANVGNIGATNANLTSITATGNITGGNLATVGNVSANYFLGNVACASGIFTTKIFNGNSEANIVSAGGNLEISIGGTDDIVTVTSLGLQTTGTLTATANITGGNIITAGQVVATGNITGGNVSGTLLTGTLTTAAQPNITSLGTLTSLTVVGPTTHTGNIDVTGNINVTGNLNYSNVTDLVVGDPLIFIGANNSGNIVDLGEVVQWNDGTAQYGGLVRDASDGVWKLFGNVTAQPTTTVDFTNALYQSILVGPLTASSGSFSTTLSATGNVSGGNINTTGLTSTATLNSSGNANVGNLGTAGLITATGNIDGGNVNTGGQIIATGNVTAGGFFTAGNVTADYFFGNVSSASGIFTTKIFNGNSEANIVSAGGNLEISIGGVDDIVTVTSTGLITTGTLTATGNVTGGNLVTAGSLAVTGNANVGNIGAVEGVFTGAVSGSTTITATGNVTGGNLVTAGQVSATGNVTGNFFVGNGSALTGINAFGTFVVAGSNSVIADSTSDTLTLVAGDGVVITTSAGTDTITISTSGSSESIFITGGDMGTVDEVVTQEQDLGLITTAVALEIDMGFIVTAGVLYPDQLVLPSKTVAELGNLSAVPAGQFVYCSDESGGSIPAFSDGTNWRRVTDRAIVT